MKFRVRPGIVDAVRLSPATWKECCAFTGDEMVGIQYTDGKLAGIVDCADGKHVAREGDWLVRNAAGELFVFMPQAFEDTFEVVPTTPLLTVTIHEPDVKYCATHGVRMTGNRCYICCQGEG